MRDVVLIDDLHDQCSPLDGHQGGVTGGHVDRDGHHLIERRGADAQRVAARRQDDPLAVRAGADPFVTLVDEGLRFVDPIRHRRHEHGAHAGRHDRRISRELIRSCRGQSTGTGSARDPMAAARPSGREWQPGLRLLRRAPATALVRRMCVVSSSSLLIRLLVVAISWLGLDSDDKQH